MKPFQSHMLLILALVSFTCRAAPSAEEIMEKNFMVSKVSASESEATMLLRSSNGGERTRKTATYTKLAKNGVDISRVSRFVSPADVKGMATLLVEHSDADDDIFVYLPSMKKTRRLSTDNKRDGFLSTDLSNGDVIGHKVKEWNHKVLREETVEGAPSWVIESLPASSSIMESSGYSKRQSWIRQDNYVAIRGDFWDESGALLKTITFTDIRQVDKGKWQAMLIEAANKQTGHSSSIKFDTFKVLPTLSDKLFEPRDLDRGE